MRKVCVCLSVGLMASMVLIGQLTFQCPPNQIIPVSDSLGSIPDANITLNTSKLAWISTNQPFTVSIPAAGTCSYPNLKRDDPNTWESCAIHCTGNPPPAINYTITFTTSNKTINGRIIIQRSTKKPPKN